MLNVLLIEDDNIDAEAIRLILECYRQQGKGIGITHVKYFREGLESLAGGRAADVVLLDLHLPDGEGPPMVRELRKAAPSTPVIAMTGADIPEELSVELVREGALSQDNLTRSIRHAIGRHQLQMRVERQTSELRYINGELETFAYIVSHDLRSPLVNLKGFSGELQRAIDAIFPLLRNLLPQLPKAEQEILRKEISQSMPRALGFIISATEKMDRLTSAILKLSRMGRREITFEPVNTNELVKQCLTPLQHQIEETRTQVQVGDLPVIKGDRTGIEQVFGNLLDNALKYLDPSRPGSISISGHDERTHTVFTVKDNGRGIAPDDVHKVFEIFRRGGDVENIPGEGMGMPYVRAIVRRHRGDIWLDSTPGKGTEVNFSIAHQQAA